MKYNIDTKELFTDTGLLLKKMQCPIDVDWEKMEPGKNDLEKICLHCNKSVLNTDFFTDEEVMFLLKRDGDKCLKVNTKKQ
jgi:hypothetical protein